MPHKMSHRIKATWGNKFRASFEIDPGKKMNQQFDENTFNRH